MAKHLHREVMLLEDFFKSLLKKFFTLCGWQKSTVFKNLKNTCHSVLLWPLNT